MWVRKVKLQLTKRKLKHWISEFLSIPTIISTSKKIFIVCDFVNKPMELISVCVVTQKVTDSKTGLCIYNNAKKPVYMISIPDSHVGCVNAHALCKRCTYYLTYICFISPSGECFVSHTLPSFWSSTFTKELQQHQNIILLFLHA